MPVAESQTSPANPEAPAKPDAAPVTYSASSGLAAFLARHNCALVASSYQSGLLYGIGRDPKTGGLHVHQSAMPKPMGLVYEGGGRLTLAGGYQIMRFENVLEPHERINNTFDVCFVPRQVHVTGRLDAHDVGILKDGRPIFVNTRFNCLATVSPRHSFEPVWMPPFIDRLVDEDRCHLNGLAMRDGKPAFVTAVSKSNTVDGWRDRRDSGGVVIDVASGKVVCEGLSMPHSPRWHGGELWVLNSGTGELGVVEGAASGKGRFVPRAFCPGFLRGLSFHGGHAMVGLSKPRYQRFEGLPLEERLRAADSEPWCGIQVVSLENGTCAEWFRIDGKVNELYDVETVRGFSTPMAVPPQSDEAAQLVTFAKPAPAAASAKRRTESGKADAAAGKVDQHDAR